MLICAVRGCRLPLARHERRVVCARGHSFDIARSGYVNLLQPQDRRSKKPGDTTAAVQARRRLHDRGFTAPLLAGIAEFLNPSAGDVVLDAGCGEGFYLGSLSSSYGFDAHGIDISAPALDLASRRYPAVAWVVANADVFIPYSNHFFSLALSITGRMNPAEFGRILRGDGHLLLALAASDDLIELRGTGRDRVERTLETFAPDFALERKTRVCTVADLDDDAVRDVLTAIYRPLRAEPPRAMKLTFSLDLLLLGKCKGARPPCISPRDLSL